MQKFAEMFKAQLNTAPKAKRSYMDIHMVPDPF